MAASAGRASGVELYPQAVSIEACVRRALQDYFRHLEGCEPGELHDLVMHAVERPLLQEVMTLCLGNQSRAAEVLGLNRATLRKKLRLHGLDTSAER